MKKLLACLLIISTLGCKSNADPKEVTTRFFEALAKEQFGEAKKYATAESQELLNLMSEALKHSGDSTHRPPKTDAFQVTNVVIKGDTATADVVPADKSAALTVHLKKENGEWKVAFDKNAIAPMIMGDPSMH